MPWSSTGSCPLKHSDLKFLFPGYLDELTTILLNEETLGWYWINHYTVFTSNDCKSPHSKQNSVLIMECQAWCIRLPRRLAWLSSNERDWNWQRSRVCHSLKFCIVVTKTSAGCYSTRLTPWRPGFPARAWIERKSRTFHLAGSIFSLTSSMMGGLIHTSLLYCRYTRLPSIFNECVKVVFMFRLNLDGEAWAEIVNKQPLNAALLFKVGLNMF